MKKWKCLALLHPPPYARSICTYSGDLRVPFTTHSVRTRSLETLRLSRRTMHWVNSRSSPSEISRHSRTTCLKLGQVIVNEVGAEKRRWQDASNNQRLLHFEGMMCLHNGTWFKATDVWVRCSVPAFPSSFMLKPEGGQCVRLPYSIHRTEGSEGSR